MKILSTIKISSFFLKIAILLIGGVIFFGVLQFSRGPDRFENRELSLGEVEADYFSKPNNLVIDY